MDTQKRDESRDRRREEALARRMGEALDRIAPRDAGECPDAELIAAYHEKALAPDETAQWESHFSDCSRCRKILAVLSASADVPLAEQEVAHLGELIAAAQAPREAATRPIEPARPSRLAWRMRWLAPAIGVAAVLAVWFAMRPPWRTTNQASPGTLIAQAPKSETQQDAELRSLDQFSKVTPKKSPETDAVAPKDRPFTREESPNPPAEALAKNRLDGGRAVGGLAPNSGDAESAPGDKKKEDSESKSAAAGAPAPPPPQAPPPSLQAQARVAEAAPRATTESVVTGQEASQMKTAPGAAANAPARDKQVVARQSADEIASAKAPASTPSAGGNFRSLSQTEATTENIALLKSPSGSIFWRVGRGGSIQRSSDAGRTWILQTSPSQQDWLAGAAFSDAICWIVGRNGSIARTIDGEHWERLISPPLATGTSGRFPDWISVTASGAQAATITGSDQRRYVTLDGGQTWRAQ
jgi:hypothetical protein